mgnify:CR=1 FL=1|jgi:hypothetical protein
MEESLLLSLGLAIVLGLIPAAIARSKGLSFVEWWVFGTLLFIIALPAALFAKGAKSRPSNPTNQLLYEGKVKRCPHCLAIVAADAAKCPKCHKAL